MFPMKSPTNVVLCILATVLSHSNAVRIENSAPALQLEATTTLAPPGFVSVPADDSRTCLQAVEDKYTWARWVIIGGLVFVLLACLLPLPCMSCLTRRTKLLVVGLVVGTCIAWLVFALAFESIIFDLFKRSMERYICDPVEPVLTTT